MSDKIGVLDESTTETIATHTVYTCPTAKAAKCSIMWSGKAGGDSLGTVKFTVNGIDVATSAAMTTVEWFHSSSAILFNDPSLTTPPFGTSVAATVAPSPEVYYLSAGDVISYTIATTAMTSISVQVVGTEIDV